MYPITNISPHSFEHLVADLLECETGERFERFGSGPDNGIDARSTSGKILQAKRYVNSSFAQLESACKSEGERYVEKRAPNKYFLATSLNITVGKKAKLVRALGNANCGSANILGFDDIQALLRKHESVARRHIGLWVSETGLLEAVINSEENGRRRAVLQAIKRSFSNYAPYPEIEAMLSQLEKKGTLIVKGPPGVGKTLLSHAIIAHYLQDGWELRILRRFGDAFKPAQNNKNTLMWFDDCLGTSKLSDTILNRAETDLPDLINMYGENPSKLLLVTTRDYIVNLATKKSDRLCSNQVLSCHFDVHPKDFSYEYRADILSKCVEVSGFVASNTGGPARTNQFRSLVDHPNFNPRLIADTVSSLSTSVSSLEELLEKVQNALNTPEKAYEKIFYVHLGAADRLTLLSVCLASTLGIESTTTEAAWTVFKLENDRFGFSLKGDDLRWQFDQSLATLNGSFLRLEIERVALANPSILDFAVSVLRKSTTLSSVWEYVSNYTELVRVAELLQESVINVLQSKTDIFRRVKNRVKASLLSPGVCYEELNDFSDPVVLTEISDIVRDIVSTPSHQEEVAWPVDILELALIMYTTNIVAVRQEAYHLDEVITWMERQIDQDTIYANIILKLTSRISVFVEGCTDDWLGNGLFCSLPHDPEMHEVIADYEVILTSRFVTQKTRENLQHHAEDALVGAIKRITQLCTHEVKAFHEEALMLARLFGVSITKLEKDLAVCFSFVPAAEYIELGPNSPHPNQLWFEDYEEWPLMVRMGTNANLHIGAK